jgi:hypothetical protein
VYRRNPSLLGPLVRQGHAGRCCSFLSPGHWFEEMEEERNTGRVIGPVGMWTTDDPRCSQCLRLSRSGWGQPAASSPDRAAPHGGRSSSPARQQLVPIIVPKNETLDRCPEQVPWMAARRPSAPVRPCRCHQSAEPKLGSRHRRPRSPAPLPPERTRTQSGSWAPRAAASSVPSLPPELGLTPGSAGAPLHALPPLPSLSSRWHSAGTLHSSAHSRREAGMIAHPLHPQWISVDLLSGAR